MSSADEGMTELEDGDLLTDFDEWERVDAPEWSGESNDSLVAQGWEAT